MSRQASNSRTPSRSPSRSSRLDTNEVNRFVVTHAGDPSHKIFDAITKNSQLKVQQIVSKLNTVNIVDMNGTSILHYAVMLGNVFMAGYLIRLGANVNTITKDQMRSPLYSAYMNGNTLMIAMLKSAGAKVIKDKYGWYPENGK